MTAIMCSSFVNTSVTHKTGNRKRRYSSSSAEDGEVCSSPERLAVGGTGTVQEQLEAACEENALLRSRLKRCELDLENSQSYAQTMREHSELLTAKLQEHRNALTAARNALAAVAPSCSCPHDVNCAKYATSPGEPRSPVHFAGEHSRTNSQDQCPPPVAHGSSTDEVHYTYSSQQCDDITAGQNLSGRTAAPLAKEADTASALASAAEEGMWQSGFVYDDRTGMYYDYSSHYYYDPTSRLYYDNNTGVYYTRDPTSGAFAVHHTVDISNVEASASDAALVRLGTGTNDHQANAAVQNNGDETTDEENFAYSPTDFDRDREGEHAPCIRAIVLASATEKLTVGTLFVVTCDGGTIGREKGLGHVIRIPEVLVSKVHAKIEYDDQERSYMVTDYGSRNGTFINDIRLSESQVRSEAHKLSHGDTLQVGSHTRLLCHVHLAGETCNSCEPGQVQAWLAANPSKNDDALYGSQKSHRQTLKGLKRRYGLARQDVADHEDVRLVDGCKDRAAARRTAVGVDAPAPSNRPSSPPSSINRPIASENKGRMLLEKLGWQAGEGLGQGLGGIAEPVLASGQLGSRSGIGFTAAPASSAHSAGRNKWKKTQARFQEVQQKSDPVDMFANE